MSRRPSKKKVIPPEISPTGAEPLFHPPGFWTRTRLILAVVALLTLHLSLAVRSLVLENPTIDEVIHLPAAITYWQKGTFRLYHHNPPLFKLVAALPAMAMGPRLPYEMPSWTVEPPNKSAFGHEFLQLNAPIYFEMFTRSRLVMPFFSLIGGLVVFAWSKRLYGAAGGLLSLALWVLCPNILAHARLLTSDAAAASIGVLATYAFWRFLKNPSWRLAALAGVALGIAQLTKFSLVVLYVFWPLLAIARTLTDHAWRKAIPRTLAQAVLVVGLSLFVIGLGYGFEGVGTPIGDFEFVCQTLTRPVPPGTVRPSSPDALLNGAYQYRVNRFRGTLLERLPSPLPSHFLLGFDEQKLEAEGIPLKFMDPTATGPRGDEPQGYPVYLNGELSQKSWWYYYFLTLIYKVPEGTWLIVLTSLGVLVFSKRSRAPWFDEFAVLTVPAVVLLVMSVFTNIAIGLRYILPIFPYVFISAGKLAPWAEGFGGKGTRLAAVAFVSLCLTGTAAATLTIHPSYLAYFNQISGGPDRGAEHLIDSNIDWGQDLVGLRRWLEANAPGERVGLAYFGQINPRIFEARGEGLDWYLPPPAPGAMPVLPPRYQLDPSAYRLEPGLYAVSATLVKGLPWRVYDSPWKGIGQDRWAPYQAWFGAFGYFDGLKPVAKVGGSIWIYRVSAEDARRLSAIWSPTSVSAPSATAR